MKTDLSERLALIEALLSEIADDIAGESEDEQVTQKEQKVTYKQASEWNLSRWLKGES